MRQKVVLDTSALIIHGKGRQDIFEMCDKMIGLPQFIVPSFVKNELTTIAQKGAGERKEAANIALQQFGKVKVIQAQKTGKTVDSSLLNYAEKNKCWICTNDRELRERAESQGIKVVYASEKYFKRIKEP